MMEGEGKAGSDVGEIEMAPTSAYRNAFHSAASNRYGRLEDEETEEAPPASPTMVNVVIEGSGAAEEIAPVPAAAESIVVDTPQNDKATQPQQQTTWLYGLSKYQFLVLFSAWLGWAFDLFDGILFNYAAPICVPYLLGMPDVNSDEAKQQTALWTAVLSSVLLVGWAVGGFLFGLLTDRIGRSMTLLLTILTYSISTAACAFSFSIWFLVAFRFFSALGIGGEYAAGAALVAETLPNSKRVTGGIILYTAAPFGTFLAFLIEHIIIEVLPLNRSMSWRIVFLTALVPTAIAVLIRIKVKEPETWKSSKKERQTSLSWRQHVTRDVVKYSFGALITVLLALIAWYSITTFIPSMARLMVQQGDGDRALINRYTIIGSVCFNLGGLIGTLALIPLAHSLSRLAVFRIYFVLGAVSVAASFGIPGFPGQLRLFLLLPVGIFIYGVFAIFPYWLPEQFETSIRGTGAGLTYNSGRIVTAAFPLLVGVLLQRGYSPIKIVACIAVFPFANFCFSFLGLVRETKHVVL